MHFSLGLYFFTFKLRKIKNQEFQKQFVKTKIPAFAIIKIRHSLYSEYEIIIVLNGTMICFDKKFHNLNLNVQLLKPVY